MFARETMTREEKNPTCVLERRIIACVHVRAPAYPLAEWPFCSRMLQQGQSDTKTNMN